MRCVREVCVYLGMQAGYYFCLNQLYPFHSILTGVGGIGESERNTLSKKTMTILEKRATSFTQARQILQTSIATAIADPS